MLLCANMSWSHDSPEFKKLKTFNEGELRNLIYPSREKYIPAFAIINKNDKKITINTKANKVLVLNFWATWCAPCREEMPSLNKVQETFPANHLEVVTVASGRNNLEKIRDFFDEINTPNLPLYRDPRGTLSMELGVIGLPTTVIIDHHGNEVARLIGPADWSSSEAIALFKHLILMRD